MGWFLKKVEEAPDSKMHVKDPNNPFSAAVVDEGEFVVIRPKIVIETLIEEENENGGPRDKLDISER